MRREPEPSRVESVPFLASDGVGGFPRGSAWIGSGPSGSTLLPNTYFFSKWNLGPRTCLDPDGLGRNPVDSRHVDPNEALVLLFVLPGACPD
jgi:hypothetical protein